MTDSDWAAEEYRQRRGKSGCRQSFRVALGVLITVVVSLIGWPNGRRR